MSVMIYKDGAWTEASSYKKCTGGGVTEEIGSIKTYENSAWTEKLTGFYRAVAYDHYSNGNTPKTYTIDSDGLGAYVELYAVATGSMNYQGTTRTKYNSEGGVIIYGDFSKSSHKISVRHTSTYHSAENESATEWVERKFSASPLRVGSLAYPTNNGYTSSTSFYFSSAVKSFYISYAVEYHPYSSTRRLYFDFNSITVDGIPVKFVKSY